MNKRRLPVYILVLCIISLIAVVFTTLYDLMLMVYLSMSDAEIKQFVSESPMASRFNSDMLYMLLDIIHNSWIHLLFNVVEAVGLIMLLRRKWVGLHVYIASQIGLMWVTVVVFGMSGLLFYIVGIIWIVVYVKFVGRAKEDEALADEGNSIENKSC